MIKLAAFKIKKRRVSLIPVIVFLLIILVVVVGVRIYNENTSFEVTHYQVRSDRLPDSFSGFKIVHISDFHNSVLRDDNKQLLEAVGLSQPDIIVLTGDYLDSRSCNLDVAISFAKELTDVAPVYYVTGNHEHRIPEERRKLEAALRKFGAHVLHRRAEYIERDGEKIQIIGVDDPTFYLGDEFSGKENSDLEADINRLLDKDCYSILLSHRSSFFETYCKSGVDLAISGHEHGGQFRIPFIGGFFAPDEGFFPKYSEGMHTSDITTMVVSRGIGIGFPFRVNNPPELVIIELDTKY